MQRSYAQATMLISQHLCSYCIGHTPPMGEQSWSTVP
jgi:hypothetical protein